MRSTRHLLLAAIAALSVSCAHQPAPQRISAEAAAAFGHAQVDGVGGSVVLDLDALRTLGFRPGAAQGSQGQLLVDFGVELLPSLAAETKDEFAAAVMGRAAVLLRLVGDWAKVPEVHRLGVVARVSPLHPEEAADGALVLVAVEEGEEANRELLQGLGASIRAVAGRELVRTEDGLLCTTPGPPLTLPFQVCVHVGPGLFALGTPKALAALSSPSTSPVAREPGPVLKLRARLPQVGLVDVTVEGKGPLRVAGVLEPDDPQMIGQVEQAVRKGLDELDTQAGKRRAVVARALGEVKESLGKDPEAPASLRATVDAATVETVVDPRGEYAALRSSVKLSRTEKALSLEATIPEGQVRRVVTLDSSLTSVAMMGVLSAIAIPNFIKYQCRSRSSEGMALLSAAWAEMEAGRAAKGRFPARPDELRARPQPGSRYALCMRSGCVGAPLPAAAAAAACEAALAAMPGGPKAPALCAAGDVLEGGKGTLDVWTVSAAGGPVHVVDGCR